MTDATSIRIKEILLATDFSPHSDRALCAAQTLADNFGARIHLFHVVHAPEEQAPARARLEVLATARMGGAPFVVATAVGSPAAEIVKHAAAQGIDLIVMGTHGRTGLAHLVMGSVAETVVRLAPCQVLTIHGATEEAAPAPAPFPVKPPHEEPVAPCPPPGQTGHCLVCALPAPDLVCDTCKAKIRGEVLYRKMQDEKVGR